MKAVFEISCKKINVNPIVIDTSPATASVNESHSAKRFVSRNHKRWGADK